MSKGSNGFAATYNIYGLQTPLWERVLEYHIKKDMMYYSGSVPKHTLNVVTAEFGLGYDAVLLLATALDSLITQQLTVTGPALATEIRNVRHCYIIKIFEPPRGKTNNVVSEQVRHKPACTSAEKS